MSGSLVTVLLGLAAMLLGIAIAVQVLQELWKYITSSRDIAYHAVLKDFLGPHLSRQLDRPGVLRDLQVRGPFQGLWWRPSGKLLPMDADELVIALERTMSEWFQRAYAAIRLESRLQAGTPAPPSPAWKAFRRELDSTHAGADEAHAQDIRTFLSAWHTDGPLDAGGLLTVFHHQFLPQARKVKEHFDQLMRNFDYQYRRRNLRQTVIIALLLAVLIDLPAGKLYREASTLSPEAAAELAEAATLRYDAESRSRQSVPAASPDTARIDSTLASFRERADSALALATGTPNPIGALSWPPVVWETIKGDGGWSAGFRYLLGCLLTAILVSFGAPFLNDLTKTLLRSSRSNTQPANTTDVPETRVLIAETAPASGRNHA
jgi:hypothetical protein